MREKKRLNKNTKCNGIRLKMPTSSGLSTSNNWDWVETLKNSFTLVKLGPLYKNGLSSISVTRVTTHSKQNMSGNTLKKKVSTTAQEMFTRRVDHKWSS
jgi:hypothetical protein